MTENEKSVTEGEKQIMHFTISSKTLQEELGHLQGVVEKKNTIPILSNVFIESIGEEDRVRFIGTDLDLTLRSETEVGEVQEPGDMCVSARKLFEISRLLSPEAMVRLKKENNEWVSVKCDRTNYKMPGVIKDTYPETPQPKEGTIRVPAPLLRLFIERTQFAITQEESRYTLSGAKFTIKQGLMRMITTDGHRLALAEGRESIADLLAEVDTIIPRKTLVQLSRLLIDFKEEIGFAHDENHLYFQIGPRLLISRMLWGTFPNWEMVLPKGCDKKVVAESMPLSYAMRRASVMTDSRSHALRLNLRPQQLSMNGQAAEEGEAEEAVPVEYAGKDLEIGFNGSYLSDFLAVAGDKKIQIELKDASSQALLTIPGEDSGISYTYVVMPLRI